MVVHDKLMMVLFQLVFDAEDVENHPLTTKEIKECCKDIKVLGKQDIRSLVVWRKKILAWKESLLPKEERYMYSYKLFFL